ncbi:hypothetical protein K3148_04745 [Qipengyuania aurantiaca]|uniref:DUF3617 family protein n=1 Tax=Qipengyuania aurantiaca TaxID=2867233 RepID=A0ABX8ZSF3_9SPHN|nr:hypothetical protein [Qipengyuania aurantiaca]QZD90704.1 hypothetical protein K3148_04745 [Qipengyuania aurantiaca]
MSRRSPTALGMALALLASGAGAQEADRDTALEAQTGEPPETIDLTIRSEDLEVNYEDCTEDQEAAIISGEIIVCRRKSEQEDRLYSNEEAQDRHAQRTMHQGDPQAPDMFGIPNHGVVVARGCFIPPCPKPPVHMIDFDELPETPKGSDAERVGMGLAPRGPRRTEDGAMLIAGEPALQANADELGLPPPLAGEESDVSPSGSASPEAEPSG